MEKSLVERLEAAVIRLESLSTISTTSRSFPPLEAAGAGAGAGAASYDSTDPSISAYDELMEKSIGKIMTSANKIGGQVLEATKIVEEAFIIQKELLIKAKQNQKPDVAAMGEFLKPLNEVSVKANGLTEGKRTDYFNHLKAAADSLSALVWIAYTGKECGLSMPTAHVEESWQMAEFYNNKVLVTYRNKDADHVEWAKALKELYISGLRDYVKKFYPLGPVWGVSGSRNAAPAKSIPASASQKPAAPKAPAPPPPPPASLFTSEASGSGSSASGSRPREGMAAVFQEISSGKPVTTGLRKVTDDMKAKNRVDRTGVVSAIGKEGSQPSKPTFSKAGPPKLELQMGRKWVVENQIGRKNLVIEGCDAKQTVYVYGCKDSVLQVKGKVNNITIDKCSKTGVVFMDVVAACEIVNCNSVEVQCEGVAPTITVDNTAGCQLYLSKDSLRTSISTSKTSEINVLVPDAGEDKDWAEHALPQQFVHTFEDGHFVTTPVSHSGN